MLDTLIDTIEILTPQERLVVLLTDLEVYRNLQLFNDLLAKGHSMSEDKTKTNHQESLNMIDDVLFTDYHEVVSKDERGNAN